MKSLQISFNDLHGNRFNGHDLHLHLLGRGLHANQLVWEKLSDDRHTFEIGRNFKKKEKINDFICMMQQDLFAQSMLNPFSYSLLLDKKFLEADIVHYHLIHNNFFNITQLPILTNLKPSIWTLHDPWALTGHCIHFFDCQKWKTGCGDCPCLESEFKLRKDTTALNWEIKRIAYESSRLDLIVSSKWMYDIVRESPLMQHFETHLIPFGLDLSIFKPICKNKAKEYFKIPQGNKVVAFRASSWKLKGLHFIKEALSKLDNKSNITLLTSNQNGLVDDLSDIFDIVELGWIDDLEVLTNYYSAADVFVMPSLAESFGMSALEAMACGTPVVGFSETALVDTIGAPTAGIAVPKGSSEALGRDLQSLLTDYNKRQILTDNAIQHVRNNFELEQYINNIIAVYRHVIDKRETGKRTDYLIKHLLSVSYDETESYNYPLKFGIMHEISLFKIRISGKLKRHPKLHVWLRKIYHSLRRIYQKP